MWIKYIKSRKFLFIFTILIVAFGVSACSRPNSTNLVSHRISSNSSIINNSVNKQQATASNAVLPVNKPTRQVNKEAVVKATSVKNNTIMLAPDQQVNLLKQYSKAIINTNFGDITLEFYAKTAPITVNNFFNLAKAGFYDHTKFHRVIKGFMIQGGDPLTKGNDVALYGTGGPGYEFKNEDSGHKLVAGSIAMANSGLNTNGSQFFIVTATATPWLDGSYTNFGKVVSGMDTVRKIEDVPVEPNPGNPREVSFPTKNIIINSIQLIK